MKQKYIKNNDKTTEITQDDLFFDNDIYENEANLPQFNLVNSFPQHLTQRLSSRGTKQRRGVNR